VEGRDTVLEARGGVLLQNIFLESSLEVDGPSVRVVIRLGEEREGMVLGVIDVDIVRDDVGRNTPFDPLLLRPLGLLTVS
jgi:hypothetical protein